MFMKDFAHTAATATPVLSPADRGHATALRPLTCGMVAGTLVETALGWKPVQDLRLGDAVQTLDGGLARVRALDRRHLSPAQNPTLVHVPGGAFDACSDLALLPDQLVVLDTLGVQTDGREDALFVLVPALALIGLRGVRRVDLQRRLEVITPLFEAEEMVYAQSGVLLRCPGMATQPVENFFPELDLLEAMAFLRHRDRQLAA